MKPCPYCGNNPVPHLVFYLNESLNIFLAPLRQKIVYNPLARLLARRGFGVAAAKVFLFLGEKLKIISRQDDAEKCKVRRAQVLWEEAEKRGLKMRELLLFGRAFDTYIAEKIKNRNQKSEIRKQKSEIRKQKSEIRNQKSEKIPAKIVFSGLPRPVGYTNNQLDLMDDKAWFKKFMQKNGLPVPAGGAAASFRQAKKIFKKIQESNKPEPASSLTPHASIITKPRSGSRGRHSTTFISSEQELKSAFKIAKQLCHWVVVEQQLFGPVYRATVINFKLEGVLRGDSPQVAGDGQSTIRQLVEKKNSSPHPGVKDIIIDEGMEMFAGRELGARIKNPKLEIPNALEYVPAAGEAVMLSEKIGVNYGGSSSEDYEICHPDNKELFERAAKVLGDPIVGFDFIIPDITGPWKEQLCGFIEVNTLPFINLHHDPLLGTPRNVAGKIWDMVGF